MTEYDRRRAIVVLGEKTEANAASERRREVATTRALTLDDLIARGSSRFVARQANDGSATTSEAKGDAGLGDARGTLFSRAPVVVTGWDNPHSTRDAVKERYERSREDGDIGDDGKGKMGDEIKRAGGKRAGGRPAKDETKRRAPERRVVEKRAPAKPTELAGARAAIGVVRDYVDYNAGYLSPDEVNADMDAPPSPIRGFAQRLKSMDDDERPRPRARGGHTRKRQTTVRSPDPEDAFSYEREKKRARGKRTGMTEADMLIAAAKRVKPSWAAPRSLERDSPGAPGSASRAGRALHAPQAFWASGEKREKDAARAARVETWSDDEEDDVRAAVGVERNANAKRALDRISKGTAPAPQGVKRAVSNATRARAIASAERKGKPGPKPGLAAAKTAAMIAAGIPIPVLPPGVKRGRGRPPRSMLIVPDGPVNSKLPQAVIKKVAEVDPKIVRKIIPTMMATSEDEDEDTPAPPRGVDNTILCAACGRGDDDDKMLLCDGCDNGYHTHCLVPKLSIIPESEWFCYECVTAKRPKTAAAAAFERRQAEKAAAALVTVHSSSAPVSKTSASEIQRVSDKIKLNGQPKLKPGPKPKSLIARLSFDANAPATISLERKTSVKASREGEVTNEKRRPGRRRKDPNAWTEEQIEALQNAQVRVDLGRKNFWTEVASYVPGKNAQQCKDQVYAGLGVGGSGDENAKPEARDDASEDIAEEEEEQEEEEEEEEEDHEKGAKKKAPRTFLTPKKPTTANANIERWRLRRPSDEFL